MAVMCYEFGDDMRDLHQRNKDLIVAAAEGTESYQRACDDSVTDRYMEHFVEKDRDGWFVNQHREGAPFLVWFGSRFQVIEPLQWWATLNVEHRIYRHTLASLRKEASAALWARQWVNFDELRARARGNMAPEIRKLAVVVMGELDTSELELAPVVTGEDIRDVENEGEQR